MNDKKEIFTLKVKSVYFKGIERARKAYSIYYPISSIHFSNGETIALLNKAQQELASLKDKFEFNQHNEGILREKAGRIIDCKEELRKMEKGVQEEIEAANELIKEINGQIVLKRSVIYDKFLLDKDDV